VEHFGAEWWSTFAGIFINHKNVKDLYPQNYKKIIEESNM